MKFKDAYAVLRRGGRCSDVDPRAIAMLLTAVIQADEGSVLRELDEDTAICKAVRELEHDLRIHDNHDG